MKPAFKYDVVIYITPLLAILSYFLVKSWSAPYSDYAAYYFGSKELLHGNFRLAYDTYQLNQLIARQGYEGIFVSYTPFTPFTALVCSPFLSFDIRVSKLLFNLVSSIAFVISLYRFNRHLNGKPIFLALAALVFLLPIKNNILFGQAYLLLFSLLTEGYIAYTRKQFMTTAVCWGMAIVFKVFPVLLLLFLVFRKEYRAAALLTCSCFVLLILSVVINGYQPWLYYIRMLPRLNNGELNDSFTYVFQSFFMFAKRTFVYDQLLNPSPAISSQPLFIASLVIFKTLVFGYTVAATFKKNISSSLAFGAWIICSLLLSPNGSTYSLVLLAIPLAAGWQHKPGTWRRFILVILAVMACYVPIHFFAEFPALLKFPRLWMLLLFFAVIISMIRPVLKYEMLLIPGLLFVLMESLRSKPANDQSNYFFANEKQLLITGTYVENGKLGYRYWSEQGERSLLTGITVQQYQPLETRNNQVVYDGKIITASEDNKKSAVLIDKHFIIYLSDKHRGIGFYTLRKIELHK